MRVACVLALALGVAGCSKGSPESQIRALIPRAASLSATDLNALANAPNPSPDVVRNQSLSVLLLTLDPASADPGDLEAPIEFQHLKSAPNPFELVEAMLQGANKGYGTMIQPQFIESMECRVNGATAEGTVSFWAPGLYSGKVEFTARQTDDQWQIQEFRLPHHRLRTSLGDDGNWKRGILGRSAVAK